MKVKNFYNCLFIIINLLILNSCKENSLLFKDTFRTNKNGWDTLSFKQINTKIESGYLLMSSKLKNVVNYSLIPISKLNQNVEITTSIQINDFYDKDGVAGIILFADQQKFPENYLLFGINSENEVLVSYESKKEGMSQIFYKQKIQKYKKKEKNSFSIVTDKSSIQFLLNDKIVTTTSKRKDLGIYFGYLVLNSSISVDNLEVKKH